MSKKWIILTSAALIVALAGVFLAAPAFAQEPTPTPTPQAPCGRFGWGRGFGFWGGGGWDTFDAAAKALNLTPEQLFAQLHAGKTLSEIAEAQGVELQTVYDAMKAAQVESMKAAIQQAVTDGKLTQEQADWLLKGIELGFFPKGGRGFRFGRGFGFMGKGMRWAPSAAPSVTPSALSL